MTRTFALACLLAAAGAATAAPILQFDVNAFQTQARDSGGLNSAFAGIGHTGSVQFTLGPGLLQGVFMQPVANGPFVNANFAGFTLTGFSGQVNLSGGMVAGGFITLSLNNGDTYSCNIAPASGAVSTYVGGGYKIEAVTLGGAFNDSTFGNVDVSPWFSAQNPTGLVGSFLQFNFAPDASGAAYSDMDLFVDVVPLPPATWAGLLTIGGIVAARKYRRR
jgi:hypothetical protein